VLIGLATGAACLLVVIAATGIPEWWYGAFTVFPTLLVGALSSFFFNPPSHNALIGTIWNRTRDEIVPETVMESSDHDSNRTS
jgi:hypothetical protein